MALPLPRTVADVGPGGQLVTSLGGMNALTNSSLQNKISASAAEYAPYTNYANAMAKIAYAKYYPYQLQAQMLSNPMMWMALKDNPGALNQLMGGMANAGTGTQNAMNDMNIPAPQGKAPGVFSKLMNYLGGKMGLSDEGSSPGQPSTNPLASNVGDYGANNQASPQEVSDIANNGNHTGSPLVPSVNGNTNAVIGKQTASFMQSPYSPGSQIPDPNNPGGTISVPTSKNTTQLQSQLSAAKRLEPQLKELANLWKPFFTLKGKAELQGQKIGNLFGADNPLPSNYADAKLESFNVLESFLKSIGVPVTVEAQHTLREGLEPHVGESYGGYQKRIKTMVDRITNDFVDQSQQQLSGGYSLPNQNAQAPAAPAAAPAPKLMGVYSPQGKLVATGLPDKVAIFVDEHPGYTQKAM